MLRSPFYRPLAGLNKIAPSISYILRLGQLVGHRARRLASCAILRHRALIARRLSVSWKGIRLADHYRCGPGQR